MMHRLTQKIAKDGELPELRVGGGNGVEQAGEQVQTGAACGVEPGEIVGSSNSDKGNFKALPLQGIEGAGFGPSGARIAAVSEQAVNNNRRFHAGIDHERVSKTDLHDPSQV